MLDPRRKGAITASEIGAIAGNGRFATRADVMRRKVREHNGLPSEFVGNVATQWGNDNEVLAICLYEIVTGEIVKSAGDKQGFVIHPEHHWLGCTPDGYAGDSVIEAKCPASMNLYGKVPDLYMPQVQGQMAITGKSKAHFICWTPQEFEIHEVLASPEYWAMCFELLNDFWQCVQKDVEPSKRKKPTLPQVNYTRIYQCHN